jgi:hypothetical protein
MALVNTAPSRAPHSRGARHRRRVASLLLALMAVATVSRPAAPQSAAPEYEIKAAFLYNFTKFVQWPPEALADGDAVVVAVLGEDPFGLALERAFQGKTVQDHPVVIRRFEQLADVKRCHVLFVAAPEAGRIAAIVKLLGAQPVLTVGEGDDFVRRGGIIAFGMEANKVRFEINLDAAERAGLKISSELAKLATRVVRNPG